MNAFTPSEHSRGAGPERSRGVRPERVEGRSKRAYPRSPEIKRLIKAGRDAGLDVAGFEASPDGTIRVVEARAIPAAPPTLFDELEEQGKL